VPPDLDLVRDWPLALSLAGIGALASGVNAVAGGGSLLSFPFLVAVRIPALEANATNAAGLWPGSLAGAIGFLNALGRTGRHIRPLLLPTVLGSVLGALLLVRLPERVFETAVPFLIVLAASILALQSRIKLWVERRHGRLPFAAGWALQLLVSVYGGYFGAGMGLMMLAAYSLYMEGDIHEWNAVKTWLGLFINLLAAAIFVAEGRVLWVAGASLGVGGIVGGFASARLSQRVNPDGLRIGVSLYGFVAAGWFAWKAFG